MKDNLSASEALYGFCGWLTSLKEKTIMSSSGDCAEIVEKIQEFIQTNSLQPPREGWDKKLIHPKTR